MTHAYPPEEVMPGVAQDGPFGSLGTIAFFPDSAKVRQSLPLPKHVPKGIHR